MPVKPSPREPLTKAFQDRILGLVEFEPNSGCWLWVGYLDRKGYGQIQVGGYTKSLAHRAAWTAFCGPIPSGLFVCHRCDTPACVNPDHLFLGTPLDNTRDMDAKGRRRSVSRAGELHPQARLTEADVAEIRRLHGVIPQRKLGERFGVSPRQIHRILHGQSWRGGSPEPEAVAA